MFSCVKPLNINFLRLLASSTVAFSLTFSPIQAADIVEGAPIEAHSPKSIAPLHYTNADDQKQVVTTDGSKLTAVHFWATWCVPCVKELVELDQTLKNYSDKGFKVVAISEDGKNGLPKIKKFYKDQNITALDIALDKDMKALQAVKARGLPVTLFLNKDGQHIASAIGALNWKGEEVKNYLDDNLSNQ